MIGIENKTLNVLSKVLAVVAAAMVAAVMLSGCGLDGGDGPKDSVSAGSRSGSAIAFSVGDSTAATRTAEGTMTLDGSGTNERSLKAASSGFGVFACHTGVHPYVSTSTMSNLMHNQLVTYNDAAGSWTYDPLVYWPNGTDGLSEYVSFFAYAPHSDNASQCIVDMSLPEETGDPWLTYQLGGTESADGNTGWKACQVDLLYDFKKDQRRSYPISTQIIFNFQHALACVGDQVTVTCGKSIEQGLKSVYMGTPVVMTLKTLELDYVLTRKGRLVLNNATQPNWQAVESEDAKVHRTITFTPNKDMARLTSETSYTPYDYVSEPGNGIFYIPLEVGDDKQRIDLSADYTISSGSPLSVIWEGTITGSVDLSFVSNASQGRNLVITLQIPEPECPGAVLSSASVGQIICSHGKVHDATSDPLICGGKKVAVVACVGDGVSVLDDSGYIHGLAIALEDAGLAQWCSQSETACLGTQVSGISSALDFLNGLTATSQLISDDQHSHAAAAMAANYKYDTDADAGSHPRGTSQWFLPSVGQWNLMAKSMTGYSEDLTSSENSHYYASVFNPYITAAGGTGLLGGSNQLYWSSTESSNKNAWYMSFEKGKTQANDKTTNYYVRPIIAF